jgi:hypothetical protein
MASVTLKTGARVNISHTQKKKRIGKQLVFQTVHSRYRNVVLGGHVI